MDDCLILICPRTSAYVVLSSMCDSVEICLVVNSLIILIVLVYVFIISSLLPTKSKTKQLDIPYYTLYCIAYHSVTWTESWVLCSHMGLTPIA